MTEQNEKAECLDVGVQHSAREQTTILNPIITSIGTVIRGIAKQVELSETLIGEIRLARQAQEKQAEQTKRIADNLERLQATADVKNEMVSEISYHVYGIHGNTAVLQPEVSRIVNGIKARPEYNEEDFHV